MDHILLEDPELARAFLLESDRQMSKLELIASENFVSSAVREAQGSAFTHKYAEGYPGKRYYGGCEFVDIAENLAIERAIRRCNPFPRPDTGEAVPSDLTLSFDPIEDRK